MTLNWADHLIAIGLSPEEALRKSAAMKGVDTAAAWWIPGRIEFLGKHTDYAGGRSLLCATERGFCIAGNPRMDGTITIRDSQSGAEISNTYTNAVIGRLTRNFGELAGADVALSSDLPVAAGLSSSSALVVGLAVTLIQLNKLDERAEWREAITDADTLAEYLSCVEGGYRFRTLAGDQGVGTMSGSEDHTAITRSEAGRLIRYSFAPVLKAGSVLLPEGYIFAIAACGVTAEKTGGALAFYNGLATQVAEALKIWNEAMSRDDATLAAALDAWPDSLEQMEGILDRRLYERVEQFHNESKILIPAAFEALERNDVTTLGTIVDRSQLGAEQALGNQIRETISLAHSARDIGAVAASAFGAGWGGSVWALVRANEASEFLEEWRRLYSTLFPHRRGTFFITRATSAARRLA